jgi:hypothetical protein
MEFTGRQSDWQVHADTEVGISVTRAGELIGQVPARDVEDTVRRQREIDADAAEVAGAVCELIERDCAQRAGASITVPERAQLVQALALWVLEV